MGSLMMIPLFYKLMVVKSDHKIHKTCEFINSVHQNQYNNYYMYGVIASLNHHTIRETQNKCFPFL